MPTPTGMRYVIDRARELCVTRCSGLRRYAIDSPGFYKAGCDRCDVFVWRAK